VVVGGRGVGLVGRGLAWLCGLCLLCGRCVVVGGGRGSGSVVLAAVVEVGSGLWRSWAWSGRGGWVGGLVVVGSARFAVGVWWSGLGGRLCWLGWFGPSPVVWSFGGPVVGDLKKDVVGTAAEGADKEVGRLECVRPVRGQRFAAPAWEARGRRRPPGVTEFADKRRDGPTRWRAAQSQRRKRGPHIGGRASRPPQQVPRPLPDLAPPVAPALALCRRLTGTETAAPRF
jgi:hypothetical protein